MSFETGTYFDFSIVHQLKILSTDLETKFEGIYYMNDLLREKDKMKEMLFSIFQIN